MLEHRLKELRKVKGITQEELGRAIGRAESTIARYESGAIQNPNPKVIEQLAGALEVSVDYLIGRSESTQVHSIPVLDYFKADTLVFKDKRETLLDVNNHGDVFYFEAADESMSPTIPKGTHAIVNPSVKPSNGDIVCAVYKSEETPVLRKFNKERGYIILLPENLSYKLMIHDAENPIEILGVVTEINYRLK